MATITIDNEAACLVQQLAEHEGKSVNDVIIEAVTDRLDRTSNKRISDETIQYWTEFGQKVRARMSPEMLALNVDDEIYDDLHLSRDRPGNLDRVATQAHGNFG